MEIGSHDHLVEGALSQAPTNGVSRHLAGEEGDVSRGEAGGGSGGGCVPHPQAWGAGVTSHEKASYPQAQQQQQQPDCWSRGTLNAVDMEDARNLVAFSASAGIAPLAPLSSHSEPQPCTTQLYEKFSQEMADKNAGPPGWGAENDRSLPMDINTLQTALSRAKHGHKPPNCDCDGPDCPDYLEWLEKKIKLASDSQQDQTHCKVSEALQSHPQPQPQSLHPHQPNGLSCGPGAPPQALCERPPAPIQCALPPIPCSPSVLSIAKEKNISLETAIALEALTQLSAPQSSSPSASSMPQHQQQASHSWEQQRAQSKGEVPRMMMPHHPTPYSPSVSPFQDGGTRSPMPQQQWQQQQQQQLQGPPRGSSPRTPWMLNNPETQVRFAPSTSGGGGDPMSELKQLLGDGSAKHTNAGFRFPTPQPLTNDKAGPRTPTIKQEVDSGDYLNAAMARYAMTNGQQQQQYPPSPLSPAALSIRHSTQAALQQHLHHKRNLFSSPPAPGPRGPVACQNLRKWWPQMGPMMGPDMMSMPMSMPMMPGIKQEPKEPKKKMSQSSPLGTKLGPPLPKPKQIVIKKVKQKASQPIFLPQNQIVVQKAAAKAQAHALAMPFLPGMEAGSAVPGALPFPIHNPSLAVAAPVPPAQSQESILNSSSVVSSASSSSSSGVTAGIPSPASVPVSIGPAVPQNGSATSGTPDGTLAPSTSTLQTSTEVAAATAQPAPLLTGLSSLDPKFEDLIRQFEEEFGETPSSSTAPTSDTSSSASASVTATNSPQAQARAEGSGQPETTTQQQPLQDANSGQAKPTLPPAELPAVHSDGQQAMEVGEPAESRVASEGAPSASVSASTQSPAAVSQISQQGSELPSPSPSTATATPPVPVSQNALLEQWQTLQDSFATPGSPSSKRIKLQTNGGVTVLSTTTSCFTPGGEDDTPTKDGLPMTPSLKGFLESPLCYLDTPTKNLLDTPMKTEPEFPLCDCVETIQEKDEGPYYNHLGSGPTVAAIRDLMESRYGEKGEAIRIEKVVYTGREGKSSQGCPIAKWVIRRSGEKEKLLCLVRHRAGHHCANAVIIIVILAWEGVPSFFADKLYKEITETLTKYGNPTSRRCGLNDDRTCACQGKDPDTCGASFSFGCSWSMYFNGCKYARSKLPRKFRLQGDHPDEEGILRDNFQNLATHVAPLYRQLAPQAYTNQCVHEKEASDCRLGLKDGRPFSGVTACMDFCAHAHKDQHNLHNGCTVVCTLTKEDNRAVGELPEDEQLHVLPLYKVSSTDEFGSVENQRLKMQTGAIQVLNNFRREVRKLPEPAKSCRQRRLEAKKAAMEKKKGQKTPSETPEKVIKTEMIHRGSPHPQQGNKAIPKQEMKPNIKKEPVDRYHSFNGALPPGYPAPGNGQAAESYGGMNNAYPYPGYYARGGLPSNSQTPAAAPVNGFHPNLPALPYGYCNYPPKALFPPDLMGYESRNGSWPKGAAAAASFDQKPDIQSLQARLGHSFPDQPERQAEDPAARGYVTPSNTPQPHGRSSHTPSPAPTPPAEARRATPVIKQEPMDVPVYVNGRPDGGAQSCPGTPSTTPQPPESWPSHRPNGLMPKGWEGTHRPGAPNSPFTPDAQMLHQNPSHHPQHNPYPQQQQQQQQWNHFHGRNTPMASPAPSPSPVLKQGFSPAPSPHPSTPRHWESPSPKGWPPGFSPAVKLENPAGGFPDKMLSQAGESRGSTPLGLQEKAWKSSGGSAASSTPSPAPEGRLFPDALQRPDAQGCWTPCKAESETESHGERELDDDEVWSDSEHNFLDPNIGGVAVAPAHGSVLIECARRELHATTPLKRPNRTHPSRISLVFYQHKNLNQPCHGLALWEAKMKLLAERARQAQEEAILLGLNPDDVKVFGKKRKWASVTASPSPGQAKDKREGVVTRLAPTLNTSSLITVSSYAYTQLTGPYSRLV